MAERVLWRWTSFFEELEAFIRESERRYGHASDAYASYVLERLETVVSSLHNIQENLQNQYLSTTDATTIEVLEEYTSAIGELVSICRRIAVQWQDYADMQLANPTNIQSAFRAPVTHQPGVRGRPRFVISRDQLEYLASLSFSWSEIASLLGVSRMTIYRRRSELNILQERTATLSDNELRMLIVDWKIEMPEIGETIVTGRLHASGHYIQRARIRRAIRSVDPLNTALRGPGGLTTRRPYSVPGPNSLWHIDGHHKLIRWRLVTHGGIDGYSRMVVFLSCSDNNRATSVYSNFLSAIRRYSVPSRLRCDQGRENYLVAAYMLEHRGLGRNSVIVGSSVHNQRIERLWRDSHRCVTQLFYRLFYYLEYNNYLNPVNEHHLAALHYVFKPRINRALKNFMDGWNHHPIRTAHNQSPSQLFVARALELQQTGMHAVDFFDEVDDSYGQEEEGLVNPDADGVIVPENTFILTDEHFSQLQQEVDPLSDSNNHGIDMYIDVLEFIGRKIAESPTLYS